MRNKTDRNDARDIKRSGRANAGPGAIPDRYHRHFHIGVHHFLIIRYANKITKQAKEEAVDPEPSEIGLLTESLDELTKSLKIRSL